MPRRALLPHQRGHQLGKQYLAETLSLSDFEHILAAAEQFFRTWDADNEKRAALGAEQKAHAEAHRHTHIIRVLRFPDTWRISCEDPMIPASVVGIFDAAASIPTASPWFKRLLFPLFIAGAETSVPHQQRFVEMCIGEIKRMTGSQHVAMTEVLGKVWEERSRQVDRSRNLHWMEYTCSVNLVQQHDYLFF
ncbi:hypothetical protein ASPACDRAFT_44814 [Aspergillus aculeatus ATCC 16872]|uniref:Uncharacterized protein n=1 Tax=Aspergillus aculeatus (strain ATCC 16872 / CBS 172.66 / WB 5094) TaxID=690307 RepID=A0A1L9WQF5_ASPA1|nr:uncharacterized protein ASPACDRAFT_44814 [Aspergillus aculeatus ATCC 16872]OJJ98307.1 hypothetical protein ASPACDRAFT_44814 [Aspergillus aculeatus ATCC 16872]